MKTILFILLLQSHITGPETVTSVTTQEFDNAQACLAVEQAIDEQRTLYHKNINAFCAPKA